MWMHLTTDPYRKHGNPDKKIQYFTRSAVQYTTIWSDGQTYEVDGFIEVLTEVLYATI